MKRRKILNKTKKGAASFYVVAFSTLILVIVAASFATIIISEITRTSNDDLAQSAYDSALAGVEDAKLAYAAYEGCLQAEDEIRPNEEMSCPQVINLVKTGNAQLNNPDSNNDDTNNANSDNKGDKCDMVSSILGRTVNEEDGSVTISESSNGKGEDNGMLQAYTCVIIKTDLSDYRSSVSSSNPVKLVPVKLSDDSSVKAKDIKSVVISWSSDKEVGIPKFNNFRDKDVVFPSATLMTSAPPTIGVSLIQTGGESFSMDSFTVTQGDQTNRGTVYLVPTNIEKSKRTGSSDTYYDTESNVVPKEGFLYSNDKTATNQNKPYLVYCDSKAANGFMCSATLQLPDPIGGDRNKDTFYFTVSLPYGRPATSFSMTFCTGDNDCTVHSGTTEDPDKDDEGEIVVLNGSQVAVDSTGKANDLFRRVEVRLEPRNTSFPYPLYGIQLLDTNKKESNIKKDLYTICEWNFPDRGCPNWQ
ncbi:hypothetical protein J5491_03205 [Candidatus Saccharibacteria bacterium]|nr:hypothetical protein [Candidatus Saccharibacteria bacterium]